MQASFGPDVGDLQWLVAIVNMGMGMGVVAVAVDGMVMVLRGEGERGGIVNGCGNG